MVSDLRRNTKTAHMRGFRDPSIAGIKLGNV
jgi:hypothetical protein